MFDVERLSFTLRSGYDDCEPLTTEIPDDPDSGQEVIGLYTHDFYDVKKKSGSDEEYDELVYSNGNGYAEWAGTSFAAAILTGILAKSASLEQRLRKQLIE